MGADIARPVSAGSTRPGEAAADGPPAPSSGPSAAAASVALAAVPPQGLPSGARNLLADLIWTWGRTHAIAAAVTGSDTVWTAARHDGLGHVWAYRPDRLEALMRADMRRLPAQPQHGGRDYLMERFRARHRAWAIIFDGEDCVAWRGDEQVRAEPAELDAALAGKLVTS
jgi:hypothetical protein